MDFRVDNNNFFLSFMNVTKSLKSKLVLSGIRCDAKSILLSFTQSFKSSSFFDSFDAPESN